MLALRVRIRMRQPLAVLPTKAHAYVLLCMHCDAYLCTCAPDGNISGTQVNACEQSKEASFDLKVSPADWHVYMPSR